MKWYQAYRAFAHLILGMLVSFSITGVLRDRWEIVVVCCLGIMIICHLIRHLEQDHQRITWKNSLKKYAPR